MFDNTLLLSKYTSSRISISNPDASQGLQNHFSNNASGNFLMGYSTVNWNSAYPTTELIIFWVNFIPPSVFPVLVHGISILLNTNVTTHGGVFYFPSPLLLISHILSPAFSAIIILSLFLRISCLDSYGDTLTCFPGFSLQLFHAFVHRVLLLCSFP